jgi:hemin uptake protein HemP
MNDEASLLIAHDGQEYDAELRADRRTNKKEDT